MRIKNTQPTPYPFQTLKRKAEELHTHSEGDVLSSPELKKQKVDGDAGEELDDLESWVDELEDLIQEESAEIDESSLPIDVLQQAVLDEIDEMEARDRKLNEKDNSIEGPKSTDDKCSDSSLDITEEFWKNPLVACFDEGEAIITDPNCPGFPSGIGTSFTSDLWSDLSTEIENYYSTVFSIINQSDVEREVMRTTMLEEHLEAAAGTFGCSRTPFLPCESGKGQTDPMGFEELYTSNLHDHQFMVDPGTFTEVLQTDSFGPSQYEKNHELIIID